MTADQLVQLERGGYVVLPKLADESAIAAMLDAISAPDGGTVRRRNGASYAVRGLLQCAAVRTWASGDAVRAAVEAVLGGDARPVRGILFDKTPENNWKVAWHQDLSVAVRSRLDVAGFGPWSVKSGVPHVQPPAAVFERMLTVRLHLDDCGDDNGPLRVIPGSHRDGVLPPAEVTRRTQRADDAVACRVPRGGALLMRPLLLHASSPATSPRHRRVVHVEYAATDLPGGLEWHEPEDIADLRGARS